MRGTRSPVRLTRRGRVVLAGLLLSVLAGLSALAASPGEAAEPRSRQPVAVVQPGDTLWSIAGRYAPGRDPFDTIDEIRRLNGLDGYTVHPGQRLIMPARR